MTVQLTLHGVRRSTGRDCFPQDVDLSFKRRELKTTVATCEQFPSCASEHISTNVLISDNDGEPVHLQLTQRLKGQLHLPVPGKRQPLKFLLFVQGKHLDQDALGLQSAD